MIQDKEDLRVTRTKKLLSSALLQLLQEEPYGKINVNEICQKAMIHRATFYNHFYDKDDLLAHTLTEIQEKIFSESVENKVFKNSKEMHLSLVESMMDYVSVHKVAIQNIIKRSPDKMMQNITNTLKRSIRHLISKQSFRENRAIPTELIVDFFTGGIAMMGFSWIERNEAYNKDDFMRYFSILLENNVL